MADPFEWRSPAVPADLRSGAQADRAWLLVVAGVAVLRLILHIAAQGPWGFHRDEFLYLAMSGHLDWGYWSTPPLIGALAWLADTITGTSLFAVRLFPLGASVATMFLVAMITREMGGRTVAVLMACIPFAVSPGILRSGALFQPVAFDIFFWTLIAWIVLLYLKTEDERWLVGAGVAVGFGVLNKYSVAFFVLALLAAALFSPHRRALLGRHVLIAITAAAVIALPNMLWQAQYGWPVLTHMRELSQTQLANVARLDFLVEQLLIHLPVVPFWIGGWVWLLRPSHRRYRLLGTTFLFVVLLLLLLRGKSYYTLGAYPMLFAAGGVWLESRGPVLRWSLVSLAIVLGVAISPYSVAYLPVDRMISYGEMTASAGIDAPLRWETGVVHPLPQDYADMLGWQELADIAVRAYGEADDPSGTVVFAENYGEAGAVEYYGRSHGISEVLSFADSYRLWAPDSLAPNLRALVYVSEDDSLDFGHLFATSRVVGQVRNEDARERGTTVFLLRQPDPAFFDFYAEAAARMKPVVH